MKSETTLVWTESRVELHTVSSVDLSLELVVLPDNSELDDSLRDGDHLEGRSVFGLLLKKAGVFEGRGKLCMGERLANYMLYVITKKSP
jgi:hypothetical protein